MRKSLNTIAFASFLALSLWSASWCRVLNVPEDFESITAAVAAADDPDSPELADTVICLPRIYHESLLIRKNIVFIGRYILNQDSTSLRQTIIEGDGHSSVIRIVSDISPTIGGLTIRNGGGREGAAITVQNEASPDIRSNIISHNESGVLFMSNSSGSIANCTITENSSRFGGSGVVCRSSQPAIRRNLIANNNGYGIFCYQSSNTIIANNRIIANGATGMKFWESSCTIEDCQVEGNWDNTIGGVMLVSGSDCVFSDCSIVENVGEDFGGIYCLDSSPEFNNCTIELNAGDSVGGLKCAGQSQAFLSNTAIINNDGRGGYGAIRFEGCIANLEECTIAGNYSRYGCAGVSASHANLSFERCEIFDQISRGEGGALNLYQSIALIDHCNILSNQSDQNAGVLFASGGCYIEIENSIIWGNSSPAVCLESFGQTPETQINLTIDYTDMDFSLNDVNSEGESIVSWDKSNLNLDPDFQFGGDNLFALEESSPCIDRGNPRSSFDPDSTVTDLGAHFYPQANLSVSTNWISFLGVYIGETTTREIGIRNIGLRPLTVSAVEITGCDHLTLSLPDDETSFILAPHTSRRGVLSYSPDHSGSERGLISILSDDRDCPRSVVFINCRALSVDDVQNTPSDFDITALHPNPFNSEFQLDFSLPTAGMVDLTIYDLQGRMVMTLPSISGEKGVNTLSIDGEGIEAGHYFLQVRWQDHVRVIKVISLQ